MPTPIRISLSQQHVELAEAEALRRQRTNESQGLIGRNRAPAIGDKALEMHKLGALGEVAVAVQLGLETHLFKEQHAERGTPDLPGDIEVKTRSKHHYDLIVQRGERPDKKIVLVTIQSDKIFLHGWCTAGEVMLSQYWSDPAGGRPAYFVPKKVLRPIYELMEVVKAI